MPPPQKGKAPTKGAKQILYENVTTINFYRNMSLGATIAYNSVLGFCFETTSYGVLFLDILVIAMYVGCYKVMKYMSRPQYTDNNQLIDPGLDLNMEGGMGEHVKDIIILCSVTLILAAVSNYFWLLLLLLPARAFWLVWKNFLGPWFFQEAPENTEQDEKKRKKIERKIKRQMQ